MAWSASASDDWQQRVEYYSKVYESSRQNPKPGVYPLLAEIVRSHFPIKQSIHIAWLWKHSDGKVIRAELYSRPGGLFVVQQDEGWNLATEGNYVYEWRTGQMEGIRIKKSEADLVDYALYPTDPALIMTGLYSEYLNNPDLFVRDAPDSERVFQLRLRTSIEGFRSVSVSVNPLCFRGFTMQNPVSRIEATFRITAPTPIPSIPPSVRERMKHVRFKDSKLTLKRHMEYL